MIPVEYDLDICRQYRCEREQEARNYRLLRRDSTRGCAQVTLFQHCVRLVCRILPSRDGLLRLSANSPPEQTGPQPVAAAVYPMQSD